MKGLDHYAQYGCMAKDGTEVTVIALIDTACETIARLAFLKSGKVIGLVVSETPCPPETDLKALNKSWADELAKAKAIEAGFEPISSPSIFDEKLEDDTHKKSLRKICLELQGKPLALLPMKVPEPMVPAVERAGEEPTEDDEQAEYLATEAEIAAEEEFEAQEKLVAADSGEQLARAISVVSSKDVMVEVSVRELRSKVSEAPRLELVAPVVMAKPGHVERLRSLKLERMRQALSGDLTQVGGGRASGDVEDDSLALALTVALRVSRMAYKDIEVALGLRANNGMTAYRLCKRINRGEVSVDDLARICA